MLFPFLPRVQFSNWKDDVTLGTSSDLGFFWLWLWGGWTLKRERQRASVTVTWLEMTQPAGSPQNVWQEQWDCFGEPGKASKGTNWTYINNVGDRHSEFPLHSGQKAFGQRKGRAGGVGYSWSTLLLFYTKYFSFKPQQKQQDENSLSKSVKSQCIFNFHIVFYVAVNLCGC